MLHIKNFGSDLVGCKLFNAINSKHLILSSSLRMLSTAKSEVDPIILTEDLPPIPPNYGFVGDSNVEAIHKINKIRASFKYGNPPQMKRNLYRGPIVMRLTPIQHCSNRHSFRITVMRRDDKISDGIIEDLGSIDPMPNRNNEILIALNVDRIKHYLGRRVPLLGSTGAIMGLAGLLPVHPVSYQQAYRNRKKLELEKEKQLDDEQKAAKKG